MRLVIEGPDGSGKTSLLERFKERYPRLELVERACTSDNGPIDDLVAWINFDLVNRYKGYYLYDRHPMISELIYSPAMGRPLNSEFYTRGWLASALSEFGSRGYYTIFCLPSFQVVQENVANNHGGTEHQDGVLKNLKAIYDLYFVETCRRKNDPRSWVWDYTYMDWEGSRMVDIFDSMLLEKL